MKKIRVLLAEDHMIVREGVRKMLEQDPDIEVIGEARDGREAVAMVQKLLPSVVLTDIAMPRLNGLEAARQMRKFAPNTKIIILSAHNDDAYIQEAIAAGAAGFLIKQASAHNVCQAIREVHSGKTFFSPSGTKRIQPTANARPDLSSREAEVLQLIAEGRANKETAADLGISIKTVEKHRQNLMAKLNIHDTAGLTRYAIAAGIIESSVQITMVD